MTLTLLLDLDDTLLNTNLEAFVPAYFQALAKELAPQVAPDLMIHALVSGTKKMMASDDFSQPLGQVFDSSFYPQINVSREKLVPMIENFYDHIFPDLGVVTSTRPEVKPLIDWAFSQGFRVAIATDPLFPGKATYHRLRWAGLDPERFELISSLEHFHFTKTYPAYYAEVLGRMGWPDGPVLMVGNDLERDIRPAQMLGLATYFVNDEPASPSGPEAGPRGKLADLRSWIESTDPASLTPSFKSIDSVLGILSATPAVMNSLLRELDSSTWTRKPAPDEWSLNELICHLRDTDREIHQMQIGLFKEKAEPFIPRPDISAWPTQRDYLHQDGPQALKEFIESRRKTLEIIKQTVSDEPSVWTRKARHAIFGPTNFLEVVGFNADHDRMHIQQAWKTLKKS